MPFLARHVQLRVRLRAQCSFCGKRRHQVPGLAAAHHARICAECLALCDEILTERLA